MPRIEGRGNNPINPSIQPNASVYQQNPGLAGQMGNEISQIGQQMSKTGFEVAQKTKQTEDTNYAFDTAIDHKAQLAQFQSDDLQKNGYDGHAERSSEFAQKLQDDASDNAPSAEAANLYHRHTSDIYANFGIQTQHAETSGIAEDARTKLAGQVNGNANNQLLNPDSARIENDVATDQQRAELMISAGTMSKDDVPKFVQDARNTYTKTFFQGAIEHGDKGLDLAAQRIKDPNLTNNLKPEELSHFQAQIEAKSEQKNSQNLVADHSLARDYISQIQSGDSPDRQGMAQTMGRIAANPKASPDMVKRLQDEVRIANLSSDAITTMKNQPVGNWNSIEDDFFNKSGNKTFGAAERTAIQKNFETQKTNLLRSQKADAASYAISSDAELNNLYKAAGEDPQKSQAFVEKSLAWQKHMGIPDDWQRVAPVGEADRYAQAISGMTNPDHKQQVVQDIVNKYGARSTQVLQEVEAQDSSLKGISFASYFPNRAAQSAILANTGEQGKNIQELFKANPKLHAQEEVLQGNIASLMQPIQQAMVAGPQDSQGFDRAKTFEQQLAIESKKRMLLPNAGSAVEESTKAYRDLIQNNFDTVKSGQSALLISKQSLKNANVNSIQSYMDSVSSVGGLKELGIKPNTQTAAGAALWDAYKAPFIRTWGEQKGTAAATRGWTEEVANHHKWVGNDKGGASLYYSNGADALIPVIDNTGNNISKNFEDMTPSNAQLMANAKAAEQKQKGEARIKSNIVADNNTTSEDTFFGIPITVQGGNPLIPSSGYGTGPPNKNPGFFGGTKE